MRIPSLTIILVLLSGPVPAAELGFLGGLGWKGDSGENTYAWQLEYLEELDGHLALSYDYLNQGHFRFNHRDSHGINLWYRVPLLDRRMSLAAGLGPLYYHDTFKSETESAKVHHGLGMSAGLAANWYTGRGWFYQLQGYMVKGENSFSTLTAVAGIGYRFAEPDAVRESPRDGPGSAPLAGELTVFGGKAVVNHPDSRHTYASALEYRRGFAPHLEWSLRALHEGDSKLTDRYGLAGQLWLTRYLLRETLGLGLGGGVYLAVDQKRRDFDPGEDDGPFPAGLLSMTASYRFNRRWLVRFIWDRVIVDYNRDADVFLLGAGYRF